MKGDTTFEQFEATLSREGTLWLESSFCKGYNGGALLFSCPIEVVTLSSLFGLEHFFRTLEEKLAEGFFLAGWLSYEAGYGFEERLVNGAGTGGITLPSLPLGWFGVYREPEHFSAAEVEQLFAGESALSACIPDALSGLSFNLSEAEYGRNIQIIKEHIAAGDLYQVNFTGRYRFSFNGSESALFFALRGLQPSSYTAFVNSGERTILSFSPELFFRQRGSLIETMPMKGTAPRGSTDEEDSRLRDGLALCQKNRAENLMIVDLLRNDLGRICKPGSVEAGELFATQTWPTLHQLVSTIRGEQQERLGLYDLFRALYPSGSITGAPKINAMKLIQALEPEPRGIYTGTIGYITPDRDMVFNVAIRTIELCGNQGIYGSGGGIVWDSDQQEEYRECQLKAKILGGQPKAARRAAADGKNNLDATASSSQDRCRERSVEQHFGLFESILWHGSYLWPEEHIERLAASAAKLGFPCDTTIATLLLRQCEEELRQTVTLSSASWPLFNDGWQSEEKFRRSASNGGQQNGMSLTGEPHQHGNRFKVKLTLSFQGLFSVSFEPVKMTYPDAMLRLCLAGHRTDSSYQILCHKTTARELYDRYFTLACKQGYDEVLFLNERGEVTEGAISTLFIRKDHQLFTPPLHSGLLNGIFRRYLLATRPFASEKAITPQDLLAADTIFIANSVRGLRPALFSSDQIILQDLQEQQEL
jgi:para-aminobenzoate synthetase / 4-amino-4-deoxychorismate lyase